MIFKSLINKIFKTKAPNSPKLICTAELISRLMKRKEFDQLFYQTNDKRLFPAVAAQALTLTEDQLLEKISVIGQITLQNHVAPIVLEQLPEGLNVTDLRKSGCIPIVEEQKITGLVCVEPLLAQKILEKFNINQAFRVMLSSWLKIAQALDLSERLWLERKKKLQEQKEKELLVKGLRTIELLINEANKLEVCRLQIIKQNQELIYRIVAKDGRCASGRISTQGQAALEYALELILSGSEVLTETANAQIVKNLRVLQNGADFELNWLPAPSKTDLKIAVNQNLTGKVLLIDDNKTFLQVIERFFKQQGLETLVCQAASSALELLKDPDNYPELIVCDQHMPEIDGLSLVKQLRTDEKLQDLPIILLTSESGVESELRALEHGVDAFVSKGEDPKKLALLAKNIITRRKARRAA